MGTSDWPKLTDALATCDYHEDDLGDLLQDVKSLGVEGFLTSVPTCVPPRQKASLTRFLGLLVDVGILTCATPPAQPRMGIAPATCDPYFLNQGDATAVGQDANAIEELTAQVDQGDQLYKLTAVTEQGEPVRQVEPDGTALREGAPAAPALAAEPRPDVGTAESDTAAEELGVVAAPAAAVAVIHDFTLPDAAAISIASPMLTPAATSPAPGDDVPTAKDQAAAVAKEAEAPSAQKRRRIGAKSSGAAASHAAHDSETPAADAASVAAVPKPLAVPVCGGAAAAVGVTDAGPAEDMEASLTPKRRRIDKKEIHEFRAATEEEAALVPEVFAAFEVWLQSMDAKISEHTRMGYAKVAHMVFRCDWRSLEEMSSDEYIDTINNTWENKKSNQSYSAALKYFSRFWQNRGKNMYSSGKFPPEVTEEIRDRYKRWQSQDRPARMDPTKEGDGSEEARKAESLPEGWRVLSNGNGTPKAWCSPDGYLYTSLKELRNHLRPPPPPETPVPKEKAAKQTPEKADPKPLQELLGGLASENDAATGKDRELLPRVLTTFARHLAEQNSSTQRQSTRDVYVAEVFKLFSHCGGRSLHAMAQQPFVEAVAGSVESRRHHALLTAVRRFQRFWGEVGGYSGDFDIADRDTLNLSMKLRPTLVDSISGICGAPLLGGRFCKRPNQRCNTCESEPLRCSVHCDHGLQECRDIFWSKHSRAGTRVKTMADFFGQKTSSKGPRVAPSDCEEVQACLFCVPATEETPSSNSA